MIRYDFQGKRVLVTGSSRGIGAAILEAFARAGARCFLNYFADPEGNNQRDAETILDKCCSAGLRVEPVVADVSRPEQVQQMMQTLVRAAGGLDILVNNAGILRDRSVRKMTLEDWHAVLDINLSGVFYCCKWGAEILQDGGRIVNISSVAAWAGFYGQANYAAAKAGVIALTRVLAKELAKRQITVNAVAPGVVHTPMLAGLRPEVLAEYEKQIPLGRLAQPSDIAHAVLFLASPESGYITGQVLPVTGGWF
ncbi:MAG: beta-ketoacyl-ACP reductase [Gemmataceae bacterium]